MCITSRIILPVFFAVAALVQAQNPIRVGGNVQQQNLVKKVAPVYPAAMKAMGMEAVVTLNVTISKEGVPTAINVESTNVDHDFTNAAMEAVREWRYKPTLLNGEPVEVITSVTVNFTLSK